MENCFHSIAINQVKRVEMSSRKMPQRYLVDTLYMRKVESRKQGPPAKKAKLDVVLAAHCRADLVTECMKKKTKTNIIR